MRWGAWVVILVVVGCERSSVRAVLGDVEISTRALHFESTFIGYPKSRALVLRNTSRTDRAVSLAMTGPFSTDAQATVPGGSQLELPISFSPLGAGNATGTLVLSDGRNVFEVLLDGQGVLPTACSPSAPCLTSVFDPAVGHCVETPAADGLSCVSNNACFLGGSCTKGLCLGSARDCADADRCTLDTCDPAGGCMHLPTTCPAPANPCKVAACDSKRGCIETDAQDGTSCGAADCSTAHVCLLGECKLRPVPDGATCAAASPCQGAGTCQQQVCERPLPTPLVEAWSYEFPGQVSGFRGVTDAAENLYWVECAFGGLAGDYCDACTRCAATSYTRDGALRFRRLLSGFVEDQPLHQLAGSQLIYAMRSSVGALAAADGSPTWTRDFYAPLPDAPDAANLLEIKALAADATGVYVVAARSQGGPQNPRQSALMKLDPSTGAAIFTRFFEASVVGSVVDEHDNLYVGLASGATTTQANASELVSLNASGTERWRVAIPIGAEALVAAYNGEVILGSGEVRSTLDGTHRVAAPGGALAGSALMGPTARTLIVDPPSPCCPICACPQIQPRIDAIHLKVGSPTIDWEHNLARLSTFGNLQSVSDAVATRQGELLIAGARQPEGTRLMAINSAGAERFSCDLEPTGGPSTSSVSRFGSPVALLAGRWAVVEETECFVCARSPSPRLRVFKVPGERPSLHGWVGAHGSPSGGSRPLP